MGEVTSPIVFEKTVVWKTGYWLMPSETRKVSVAVPDFK